MLDGKVNFERVCGIVKEWKWCELKERKKILGNKIQDQLKSTIYFNLF